MMAAEPLHDHQPTPPARGTTGWAFGQPLDAGKKPNPGTPADQRLKGRGKKPGPKPKRGK